MSKGLSEVDGEAALPPNGVRVVEDQSFQVIAELLL
jgi:hypothetical protein